MALTPALEKLVSMIEDPAERERTRKELTENVDNGLRQQDYSRKMNELSTKQKEWQTWHQKADAEYKAAVKEREDLKSRLATLEAAKRSDDLTGVSDEGLDRALREARAELSEAKAKISQFDQLVSEGKLVTAEKMEEVLTQRGDNLGAAIFDVIRKQNECSRTYGKELDEKELIAEAQRRGGDLQAAYDHLTAPYKEEKMRKDIEAQYEAKYQERLKTANLPIETGGGGEPTLGPLQVRLMKKDTSTIPEDVPADGSGRLASMIAQELRADGKY